MQKARDDFNKRRTEIIKYFEFLEALKKDNPTLLTSNLGLSEQLRIDDELIKILKANGFLLLYNLVEAITRIALSEYLYVINDANISFKQLNDSIQKLWIKNRKFQEKQIASIPDEEFTVKVYKDILRKIILPFKLELLDGNGKVTKEFIEFSGNIDVRKINDVIEKYGITLNIDEAIKRDGSRCLYEVKNKRNDLAHGRTTFAESTKNCSIQELCSYKDGALDYLEAMLAAIENHAHLNKFKKTKSIR